MFNFLNIKKESGSALYLALVVMTVLLSMALGLSSISIGQMKTIKQMGNSVLAFCAADAGIEIVLLNRDNPVSIPETPLANGATYQVLVTASGTGTCPAGNNYCIESIGSYLGIRRAIAIIY